MLKPPIANASPVMAFHRVGPMKANLIGLGGITCAAVMPVVETLFTARHMMNSSWPLLMMLGVPFLASLLIAVIQPNSVKATAAWIGIGAIAFLAGDAYTILRDTHDNHNLWPIELVILTGLAAGALIAGALSGRWMISRRLTPQSPR